MQKSLILSLALFLFLNIFSCYAAGYGRGREHGNRISTSRRKLFVFGDSYADTGNWNTAASSWKDPYGVTFPGKPTGRFSDGRILTDYVASYFRVQSPVPYEQWKSTNETKKSQFGMNFAYGGTGVFDTGVSQPNMTSQIDIFENLIKQAKAFTQRDLRSSVALVSLGGNDYSNYIKGGANLSLPEFTKTVVNQLVVDLQRIQSLGVPRIAVTSMEPIGCLPALTVFSGYTNCTVSLNEATSYHNQLLQQDLERLNNQTKIRIFFLLDLYGGFLSALQQHTTQAGSSANDNSLLKPCCEGITIAYGCGSVEGKEPKYRVCDNRNMAFFWDSVHPAQHGWNQVYLYIQPTLKTILNGSGSLKK